VLHPDRLASVQASERRLRTVRGDVLEYDALLVAVGARAEVGVPGALIFQARATSVRFVAFSTISSPAACAR